MGGRLGNIREVGSDGMLSENCRRLKLIGVAIIKQTWGKMKSKKILISFIICSLLIFNPKTVLGNSILSKIDVLINGIGLYVNNEQIVVDNFIDNGTTYVPLRAIAEMIGMEVDWNGEDRRVDLISNQPYKMETTDGKYRIIHLDPEPLTDGNYLRWDFMNIVFDVNTKGIKDRNSVVLIDYKGNRTNVRCQPGLTKKNNFLIVPDNELDLNSYYSLYIPKGNIIMENDDLYNEDILIYFKTATNVISGQIISNENLFSKLLVLTDNSGREYSTNVVGSNEFYFTNLSLGKYAVTLEGNSLGTISVEENKINNVRVVGQ